MKIDKMNKAFDEESQAIQDLEKEGRIVKTGEYGATGKALLSRSM